MKIFSHSVHLLISYCKAIYRSILLLPVTVWLYFTVKNVSKCHVISLSLLTLMHVIVTVPHFCVLLVLVLKCVAGKFCVIH